MYKILDVCQYIIKYSNDKDYGISNLKLQKILYFIQAAFLINKEFGSCDIPYINYTVDVNENNIWDSTIELFNEENILEYDRRIINEVIDKFADYSGSDLTIITQNQTPWKISYEAGNKNEITIYLMKEYFSDIN